MRLIKIKFVLAFIICAYTGFRIISNSINFYYFDNILGNIIEEWLFWFKEMPYWWPIHFVVFIITSIYIINWFRSYHKK